MGDWLSVEQVKELAQNMIDNLPTLLQLVSMMPSFNPVRAGESQQVIIDFKTGQFLLDASEHVEEGTPATLPPLPAAVEVAVYRIVQEAINNALKHAQANLITVTLTLEQGDKLPLSLRVEICDNGVGLPKQNRGRLIEPYVTTRAKGTGLGLAIVQKIIEQHGGTLSLEDSPSIDGQPALPQVLARKRLAGVPVEVRVGRGGNERDAVIP